MKKTAYILLTLVLGLTSCQDFLSVEQKGKTTIPVFLSYPAGLEAGMNGAYNKAYGYIDNEFTKYGDVAGNMVTMRISGSTTDMVKQYNYTSEETDETGAVGYIWRKAHEAMANANNVIQYQPDVLVAYPQEKEMLNRILGEAYVLRAMCHFDLCRVYGQPWIYSADASHLGVPVLSKTPGPNDNPSRNTVAQVYDFVIKDLKQACQLLDQYRLDTDADIYHLSLDAAEALLARVYLYQNDWEEAYSWAKRVADSHPLATGQDYIDMYRTEHTRGEAIFRLSGIDQSGKLKPFYDQVAYPADTLLSLFDANDLRLQLLRKDGSSYCCKYLVNDASESKRDDPMVMRASEFYLTAAEAACHLSQYQEARTYLRPILQRAVDAAYADQCLDVTSDDDLLALVLRERTKELCFEGHCFFDLARTGRDIIREASTNSTMRRLTWPDPHYVLPLPLTELSANLNMQGNPVVNP